MRRLLRYLRPYRLQVAGASAAIIAHSGLELVPPLLTKTVIDRYIPAGDLSGLGGVAVLYLLTLCGSFALEYVQTTTMQMIGQRIMLDLRMQIYGRLQRLDLRFYDRNPVGRLMTRLTTDVDALNELFTSGVVAVFGDLFTLIGIMAVLIWMDWRLAAIAFSVLPLIALLTQWFRVNVRESYRTVRVWIARINAFLQERITGMATVHLFRREARDFAAFEAINGRHRDANVRSIFFYAIFYPAIELVSALASALILWFGGLWVMQESLSLGSLVAFLLYAQRFFRPISDMSEKFNVLQGAMASSERIFVLLDTHVAIESPPQFRAPERPGPIAFEHVTFAYIDGEPVLRDVSFRIEPGERVGIVGATGAGKTTLVNLLLRYYDVQQGRITVDGIDIREMDPGRLRGLFGLVLQDVHLFSGTVASNVRLGNDAIDDAAVRAAIEAVHADGFVNALPRGIETPVVERGATLSVGQKQMLSFARALAFDRPVLILDEATSSVDTETELLLRDAVRVIMQGRTTIAIAHRLSTLQGLDRILVFHKGQLREAGTHQALLAARGIYHRLYQLQFQRDAPVGVPSKPATSTA
ncbi:MAG: antibiotic ABC transporter ATP-binding protein [Acidobacteria bacterium RIFCSPLOWO2_12_FULL_67_14]|nr:MAG: antibiotic ABC transporter ATP-binding protein [Acidobacteria bacterium RIFCSPLOWO2_02_FULL_67_21]OFW37322.1 MAG: antibiotic ABC transporter ATP-binding protein [Acidobacteria bacterium RIFCSPLOWO2_12_FULL_67_14]